MPRFFFNTRDGDFDKDETGTELQNLDAARVHGIVYAGELLTIRPDKLDQGQEFNVEVTDSTGLNLFTVTCYATNSPAGGDTK